jgi:phytoene synthase
MSAAIDAAYAEVQRVTRARAKNFAYGIMVLPREKRRAIAAVYAFAREVDDVADGDLPLEEKRARLEALRAALDTPPGDPMHVALTDARARFGIPHASLAALVDGGLQDLEQNRYATFDELRGYCEKVAGAVGVACVAVYGSDDIERAMTLGIALQLINIMRDVAEDDALGRVYLPQDELDRFGVRELGRVTPEWQSFMAFQAERARVHLTEGLRLLDSLDRRSALCVSTFAGLYRGQLDRIEANGFDVFGPSCRLSTPAKLAVVVRGLRSGKGHGPRPEPPMRLISRAAPAGARAMKVAVVGGGLAGLSAALDLADAGVDVVIHEARPSLGGAVQTLPARDGDPEPPPDNGQHIALGCFTEYLRFLDRIGESGSVSRTRLALPVIDENGVTSLIKPTPLSLLSYGHISFGDRLRLPVVLARLRRAQPYGGETFGAVLRRLGASDAAIERFWDVFIRPALNLRTDEVDAAAGLFTVRTALLGPRGNADLVERVESLDDLDADAIVVAVPPRECARLLDEPDPLLEDSPIVSVHLWFDRPLLKTPLAALLRSDAHWVFDRGALTGHRPAAGGQYLTVVSSGVPELLDVRGKELVDRIAAQLTDRLGAAELLWSRVSREPYATVALRPGVVRPGPETKRPGVVRAGTWTDTGWPATMESAVRSGRTAAARVLERARSTVGA